MMLRHTKNYIKIVNQKVWIRPPVNLHSTDAKNGFPSDGARSKQKVSVNKLKNSEQILCNKRVVEKNTLVTAFPPSPRPPVASPKVNFSNAPPPKPPSSQEPKSGSGSESDKNYKQYIWPLLIAAGALGGVYYSGILDSSKDADQKNKKKELKDKERAIKRIPENASELPEKAKYLLVGGGTASFAAFRAIKANDPKAKILVVSNEDAYPYMRPPLSKEIWQYENLPDDFDKLTFKQWNGKERSLYYEPPEFYMRPNKLSSSENGGVAVATGWNVSRIDAEQKKAYITVPGKEDKEIAYERCLIATGCRPRSLPQFEGASKEVASRTILFRNIRDLDRLWRKLQDRSTKTVVIVGGGFLGSELACSLGRNNNFPSSEVVQIFKEPGNMGKALPEYLCQWTTGRVKAEGVKVMASSKIEDVKWSNGKVVLRLNDDRNVTADLVILAVGCEPCTELADSSNLEVDSIHGGFLVNAELEARRDLFVAGDSSCFFDPLLGRRRVEHHDHAVVSGRLAGENMAAESHKPYKYQSMFWSDLSPDLGYEAIGLVDPKLRTVGVFAEAVAPDSPKDAKEIIENVEEAPTAAVQTVSHDEDEKRFSKGVLFYLRGEKIVGIILWNVFNRMHIARQVLEQNRTYSDLNEVAKLFRIHDD